MASSLLLLSHRRSLLWKLPLLEGFAEGISYGFTPPHPPPEKSETEGYDASEARESLTGVGVWGPRLFKIITRSVQLYETYLILYDLFPTFHNLPIPAYLRPSPWTLSQIPNLRTSPSFAIGVALVCLGAYIRVLCFRHLGKQFTFQLSIRKDHHLITSGPYSIVRHPSYAGGVVQIIGMILCLAGPSSWFKEIGVHTLPGKVVGTLVGLVIALGTYGGIARTFKEDVVLKNTFKEEWEEWAKKTPYRLFPYIF
ncbi:hypothetical protein BDY19DRAFT_315204 [Irpex rosettiformis]|uniref:Uncharacterized protein n=1 Tax=Irpex rosettiformis TaxID=378272 RepID=A0ACB8TY45_9APHY|nr:hypothetical protein BDY19DRAFT_315204 [Irpex rosettiformis]